MSMISPTNKSEVGPLPIFRRVDGMTKSDSFVMPTGVLISPKPDLLHDVFCLMVSKYIVIHAMQLSGVNSPN